MGFYDDTMANITRQQYNDYVKRFLPTENRLIDLAQSDELLRNQLARNEETVSQQFERAGETSQLQAGRMGLDQSQTAQQETNTDLQKSLTLASVQNETRQAVGNLQDSLITGASGSASQLLKGM